MPFEENEGYNNIDQLKKILDQLVNFYCECNTDEVKVVSYGITIDYRIIISIMNGIMYVSLQLKILILFFLFQNDSDSLLDITSNVAGYSDIIKQILCVYQSLIVYIVNSWSNPNQDKECYEKLTKLFSKYNHIVEAVVVTSVLLLKKIFYTFVVLILFRHQIKLIKRKTKEIKKIKLKQLTQHLNLPNLRYIWTLMIYTSFFLYLGKNFSDIDLRSF